MQTSRLPNGESATHTGSPQAPGRAALAGVGPQPSAVLVVDFDVQMELRMRVALAGPLVRTAGSLTEALRLTSRYGVGALAVVSLRVESAADVIRGLRAAGWQRVLVLTDSDIDAKQVLAALDAGAHGVVSRADRGPRRRHRLDFPSPLSRREVEVVRLVAQGLSNRAIGQQLSVSALTVKNRLTRAGRKLGARDRARIVALACRQGVIVADK